MAHRPDRRSPIRHILERIPYKRIEAEKVKLPGRSKKKRYDVQASLMGRRFMKEVY